MAINRKRIIEEMSKIEVVGDDNGLIEGFNVLMNQLPADFWNNFADRLTQKLVEDILEPAEFLLINAAHECGYHTGYGIITSEEWKAVVEPMIEKKPEDILYGLFAVITAFGWAKAEILELKPAKQMIVRAYNYYEADIVKIGYSDKLSAYMLTGISAAFMDLAYGGSYDPKGSSGIRTFRAVQTKGLETGDDYGEFLVRRNDEI